MRRRRAIAMSLGGLAVVTLGTIWAFRQPLVTQFVDRTLAEAEVDASYTIDRIGLGHQRLTNVRIGPAARPDLTAREVDLWIALGVRGPYVARVRARGVRMQGRWTGAELRFGQLDQLLPADDGQPFSLPELFVDVADAGLRIDSAYGPVAIGLAGRGALDRSFVGQAAVLAPRLSAAGCGVRGLRGALRVSTSGGRPSLDGPVRLAAADCPAQQVRLTTIDLGLRLGANAALTQFRLAGDVRRGGVATPYGRGQGLSGPFAAQIGVDGAVDGDWRLGVTRLASEAVNARALGLSGTVARDSASGRITLNSGVALRGARLVGRAADAVTAVAEQRATPVIGPLAARLSRDLGRAGRDFDASLAFTAQGGGSIAPGWEAAVQRLAATSASGASLSVTGVTPLRWTSDGGVQLDGIWQVTGGGLPQARLALRRRDDVSPVEGSLTVAPYAADGAVLAMPRLDFTRTAAGDSRFATAVSLSGPLPDGRIDGLRVPLSGRIGRGGQVVIDGGCRAVAYQQARLSSLALPAGALMLCGRRGGPLLTVADGRLAGGFTLPASALRGRLGGAPFGLSFTGADYDFAAGAFAANAVAVTIGAGETANRLTLDRLTGRADARGWGGDLSGGNGRIGVTPFDLSAISGDWRWQGGALTVTGRTDVTDAIAPVRPPGALLVAAAGDAPAPVARFEPMMIPDVTLRLADSRISMTGTVQRIEPAVPVARLDIRHDLASGAGGAEFSVIPLTFDPAGLQPEQLSTLALGVVANVEGQVRGGGQLRWADGVVTSEGAFSTEAMNLAAAFGPVRGLTGTIRFDDLIGLTTRPGQRVSLASVNPGIEVTDGELFYQLLPERQVRIEGGRWPFAGGTLRLHPTWLDMATEQPRHLNFDVEGVDAAVFIQRFDFDNIAATGIFDGVLPTVFDGNGGRVDGGRLVVRDGGGTLAYVGELTNRDLGYFANIAFGALRSLRYDSLAITLNGRIDGEMLTEVRFSGLSQGEGAVNNFLTRQIAQLPFMFVIRINAPFRQLLSSARSLYDPTLLIDQNLSALVRAEQEAAAAAAGAPTGAGTAPSAPPAPVQPPDSENRP